MNHQKMYEPGTVLVLVGTKRGLFLLTSRDRETWEVESTALKGSRVFFATLDQRDGRRLFAADNGDFLDHFCAIAMILDRHGMNLKSVFNSLKEANRNLKISGQLCRVAQLKLEPFTQELIQRASG